VDCLIERLIDTGTLKHPQMFIRKQGKHTLTKSGRRWKWARGEELLDDLETKDENGNLVVDYINRRDLQFAIALVDDGHTECGHLLELPLTNENPLTVKTHFEAHLSKRGEGINVVAVHNIKLASAPDVSNQEWSARRYQIRSNEILVRLECKSEMCTTHEHPNGLHRYL